MTDQQSTTGSEEAFGQGQQLFEQALEFQRDAARMALSALEWQEAVQRQGLEMTRSMLQPSHRSTQAVAPEMEQAMQQGAASMEQEMGTIGGQYGMEQQRGRESMGPGSRQRGRESMGTGQRGDQPMRPEGAGGDTAGPSRSGMDGGSGGRRGTAGRMRHEMQGGAEPGSEHRTGE